MAKSKMKTNKRSRVRTKAVKNQKVKKIKNVDPEQPQPEPESQPQPNFEPEVTELDRIWNDLQNGMKDVYARKGMTTTRYMQLYSHVYNYGSDARENNKTTEDAAPRSRSSLNYVNHRGRSSYRDKNVLCALIFPNNTDLNSSADVQYAGEELYKRMKRFLKGYLAELVTQAEALTGENVLSFYTDQWTEYRFSSKVLNGICSYLNKHWVRREYELGRNNVCEIYDLALVMWRKSLFLQLQEKVTDAILRLIDMERKGDKINQCLLKNVITSYVELGVEEVKSDAGSAHRKTTNLRIYQQYFEEPFLIDTTNFYQKEPWEFLQQNSVTDYMKKAEQRMQEERKRCDFYLHETSMHRLLHVCEFVMVFLQLDTLLGELKNLLIHEKDEDVSRMFALIFPFEEAVAKMVTEFESHVCTQGLAALAGLTEAEGRNCEVYITRILDHHKKYSQLVVTAFKNYTDFVAALDRACTTFVNNNAVTNVSAQSTKTSPYLLAKYCDILMKRPNKNGDDSEVEEKLNQMLVVFKYIEDKDVFQSFYSQLFALRLMALGGKTAIDESERNMIGKLKQICGFEYTSKLQRMYQDIEVSRDLHDEFKQYLTTKKEKLHLDFQAQILSSGFWLFSQKEEFNAPPELLKCLEKYREFYNTKHSGRALTWLYSKSKGDLARKFGDKLYTFNASTLQMAVLLLFNSRDSYTIQEIAEAVDYKLRADIIAKNTNMKVENLYPVLQVILKSRVLKLTEEGDDMENLRSDMRVELFHGYKNKKLRVNINQPLKGESKKEDDQVHQGVIEERRHVVRCIMVRIMKMRKAFKIEQLIGETMDQIKTRFKADRSFLKNCIATLVKDKYMELDENQTDTYKYMA